MMRDGMDAMRVSVFSSLEESSCNLRTIWDYEFLSEVKEVEVV